jgi:ATP-dependent RNA helicase SUPV3L1/SUV3
VRSWAYITQRPDWVLAREEMAARARAVETRLSDALHGRLTERFVNRRTTVLMRKAGADAGLLPVRVSEAGAVLVDDEPIGHLEGFRFVVDPLARAADRKLLLAAAERHLPALLAARADALVAAAAEPASLSLDGATLLWDGLSIARLEPGKTLLEPRLRLDPALGLLPARQRAAVIAAVEGWLARRIAADLAPLCRLAQAARAAESGPDLRALLLLLVAGGGVLAREDAGLDRLDSRQRDALRRLGVRIGALDLFMPAALRPLSLALWCHLAALRAEAPPAAPEGLPPVVRAKVPPAGYRRAAAQAIRVDLAEKLLQAAHRRRIAAAGRRYSLDPALARSMGLATAGFAALLRAAGFRVHMARILADAAHGPPAPPLWDWKPPRSAPLRAAPPFPPPATGAFAALAELMR